MYNPEHWLVYYQTNLVKCFRCTSLSSHHLPTFCSGDYIPVYYKWGKLLLTMMAISQTLTRIINLSSCGNGIMFIFVKLWLQRGNAMWGFSLYIFRVIGLHTYNNIDELFILRWCHNDIFTWIAYIWLDHYRRALNT